MFITFNSFQVKLNPKQDVSSMEQTMVKLFC